MTPRLAITTLLLVSATSALHAEPASTGRWNFRALLDGSPIGTHSYTVTGTADRREMDSRADFTVKVLGITAYTYRHNATEQWRGDCLDTLSASTDDDGKKSAVTLQRQGDATTLSGPQGRQSVTGCVMTFAYWNPQILKATKLLNPQSGKYEAVQVTDLGAGTIETRGERVAAQHYRIDGPERPIELWYSSNGDWLGLDSMVGKRRLSYRLE